MSEKYLLLLIIRGSLLLVGGGGGGDRESNFDHLLLSLWPEGDAQRKYPWLLTH